jgi:prepilin-type N-terminal cleavage/methylation domain-containing protein
MNRATRPRRRGFTVMELVLALVLAAIVALAGMGVLGMMSTADGRLSKGFDDASDLAAAQVLLRRSTSLLLAAAPLKRNPTAPAPTSPAPDESEGESAEGDGADDADTQDEADSKGSLDQAGEAEADQEPHFDLYYSNESGSPSQGALQSLEVVLIESPFGPQDAANSREGLERYLPVRGVFEAVSQGDELSLVWTPIDPPGPSHTIIRRLVAFEWWVLPRHKNGRDWTDIAAASLDEDYPVALRLLLWTAQGTHADWLFDLSVYKPGGR